MEQEKVLTQEEIKNLKEDFKEAVDNKRVKEVRLALSNELLLDPSGKTFADMLIYAKENLPNLFEVNKEAYYTLLPEDQWDESFLFKVKNDLDANFSIEKLVFYQEVINKVGENLKPAPPTETIHSETIIENLKEKSSINPVTVSVTAGGAVLTAIGICLGKTLFTIFGGAALVGGVLLLLNDRNKK